MNTIISLSGRDGVGKTQQIQLLRDQPGLHVTNALKHYGDKWPKLNSADEFEWWFGKNNFDGFLDVITDSINKRNLDKVDGKVTIHERGTLMFLAVCLATLATRRQISVDEIQTVVKEKFLSRLTYSPYVESSILLVEDVAYKSAIRELESGIELRASHYTDHQNQIYQQYQKNLHIALERCFPSDTTKIVTNQSIVDIQNQIRRIVSGLTGSELDSLCGNLRNLVCVGGMSESGKSQLCQNLHVNHGSYRLKLRYFSKKFGENASLVEEILRFLHEHPHITLASIESLHNPELPVLLKKMLGTRTTVIYLDAPEDERVRRHQLVSDTVKAGLDKFLQKESVKESRGAHKVRLVADLVIDTSLNTPEETCDQVFKSI
ncbi:MAG: hypothetical protein A3G52_01360 [Candidatus Taylorbacteria bacterium RIFCSPLOWO2_12_FULL_43_20]|uniref:Uncharacterized protein n=1 Tax=Candidatus Taylorbacteria bacterium RIFCSPLOWO2_12_FULL_43_20 TaxID=1802332 RepID=A0A1G2P1X7_9BACT|nr:MAG: hypothetical protein A2825_01925 [Candidatus Taylorbacteria bacterium RIFCSPHIGHO2_01_FULL_43_120]OHA23806.1 MAG: hypothetical protein A3B98_04600 [Candidatus Taylorbacteria bacterium RIFCSPHIGHO2_02_FULL_43_55]OHA29525.1 MAG: hypothetical protein A3E92_01795 [Candidatus Taylorbacteria bacterium RIFCSPHIGHO2_12_FULL_42_34]OHA31328.1 MAG: hypothetical protein A3B09_02225 [Candidatus Taylorbacteria bacterium RIFCSPLOWO2_01_FULL_43_83]OHA38849.1 MAG: hypothetical protein A3H58_00465 [Candi